MAKTPQRLVPDMPDDTVVEIPGVGTFLNSDVAEARKAQRAKEAKDEPESSPASTTTTPDHPVGDASGNPQKDGE